MIELRGFALSSEKPKLDGGFMQKNHLTTMFIPKVNQKQREQITSNYKHKVVRKFALETKKSMHSF